MHHRPPQSNFQGDTSPVSPAGFTPMLKATRQQHTTVDDQFRVVLLWQRLRVLLTILQQWGHRRSPAVGLHDCRA